jgi:hypothetical protein
MNRCIRHRLLFTLPVALSTLNAALILGSATLTALPLQAQAQVTVRQFPAMARRGTLEVLAPPDVAINGNSERLSPGYRIRGANNNLVMSGQIVGQQLLVNYVRNPQGLIHDIWILNDLEAQQARPGGEPTRNFAFESDPGKPKTDDGKTPFDQLPKYQK